MPGALSLPCLCLVTDRRACGARRLDEVVSEAVAGGVNMVQLREKDLSAGELLTLAVSLRAVTEGRALLFVNDRVDVALACRADGVQLGERGVPVGAALELAGGRLLIGRSVHGVEGAREAEGLGAGLLVVGTVFPSSSHPGAPAGGLDLIAAVSRGVRVPLLAIGGITVDNAASAVAAGASGVAAIAAIMEARDPGEAAATLTRRLREAWQARAVGADARR